MWPLPRKSAGSSSTYGKKATEPSRIIRLLLRKRYSKLGPVGDYAPTNKFNLLRIGSSRRPNLNETGPSSSSDNREQVQQTSKLGRSASTSSVKRSVMQKFGDTYVDVVWSAASHVARPIAAKPKVPLRRAVTFEKMFGVPHDTVLKAKSLNALHAELIAAAVSAELK